MLSRIKINLKFILSKFTLIASVIFGLVSVLQSFLDWDTVGIDNCDTKSKIIVLIIIVLTCFAIALIWGLLSSKEVTLLSEDDVKIVVKYGDLMKIAFPKKKKSERIVVIAVNRCYDTIVDDTLIRDESVHGQFLKNYASTDEKRNALDIEIENSLKEYGYNYESITTEEKRFGKLKRYPVGSVARIKGENGTTFFLLAFSTFNINCKAECDKHQYYESVLKMFEYYDEKGQGKELYLYPMGSGMSRTGLSRKEALESVILLSKISKKYLKNKTTIVVDKKCKNELSITNL